MEQSGALHPLHGIHRIFSWSNSTLKIAYSFVGCQLIWGLGGTADEHHVLCFALLPMHVCNFNQIKIVSIKCLIIGQIFVLKIFRVKIFRIKNFVGTAKVRKLLT